MNLAFYVDGIVVTGELEETTCIITAKLREDLKITGGDEAV